MTNRLYGVMRTAEGSVEATISRAGGGYQLTFDIRFDDAKMTRMDRDMLNFGTIEEAKAEFERRVKKAGHDPTKIEYNPA